MMIQIENSMIIDQMDFYLMMEYAKDGTLAQLIESYKKEGKQFTDD